MPEWLSGLLDYLGITPANLVPLMIFGLVGYILISRKIFIILKPLTKSIQLLNHTVIEIQTYLESSRKTSFKHQIMAVGQTMSPLVLKRELKPLIEDPGLAKQINEKLPELVKWLREQKPITGIEAQDKIDNFVLSGKVRDYLDLTKYEEHLYQKGKTSVDTLAILTVYLYEVLIPRVIK